MDRRRFTSELAGRVLLGIILVALLIRLGLAVVTFGRTSLQMDFSAFYAAGQSVQYGLSPYINHVDHDPPIWDGIDKYRHSRFLYPPPAAWVFRPFASLPYSAAKFVWMGIAKLALGGALLIAARLARLSKKPGRLLGLAVFAAAFFPLLTLLERGQIDSLTLLLVLLAIFLARRGRHAYLGGIALAVATLLKLYCIFLVPFLLLRRRWAASLGFLAGSVALLAIGLLFDGYASVSSYVANELPRISRYGEGGTREMLLAPNHFRRVAAHLGPDRTVMDGREYRPEAMSFILNASLVRTPIGRAAWSAVRAMGLKIAPAQVSLVFIAIGFGMVLAWSRWRRPAMADDDPDEFIYWQIALVLILLCAPVSWAMGTVWLLPAAAIVLREGAGWRDPYRATALVVCSLGLILAAMPDRISAWPLGLFGAGAPNQKYVVAELLVIAGLFGVGGTRSPVERLR